MGRNAGSEIRPTTGAAFETSLRKLLFILDRKSPILSPLNLEGTSQFLKIPR